jgi:myo-inositol 2-dehydrogenase/D-chiro-inositol 1-dehydrogenase
MMIHDFDMARFLLKEEPAIVHALGGVLVDPAIGKAGDVDTAAVHMQTASGKICVITNPTCAVWAGNGESICRGGRIESRGWLSER